MEPKMNDPQLCVACNDPIKHQEVGVWVGDQGPYCPECYIKRVCDDNKTHEVWKRLTESRRNLYNVYNCSDCKQLHVDLYVGTYGPLCKLCYDKYGRNYGYE